MELAVALLTILGALLMGAISPSSSFALVAQTWSRAPAAVGWPLRSTWTRYCRAARRPGPGCRPCHALLPAALPAWVLVALLLLIFAIKAG